MPRQILIVDDHDDLASELSEVFRGVGNVVQTIDSRLKALSLGKLEDFDLIITDLDNEENFDSRLNGNSPACFPTITENPSENLKIKAFKICARNFNRGTLDETELKEFFDTILNFKTKFIDKAEFIQNIREKIEFEFPSTIAVMHTILDYLMTRIEKVGVINPETSNLFIALDEAFVNAVKHGNKFDAQKLVRITAEVSTKEARFTIEDEGEGFDVNSIPDPTNPENLFKSSGRGVMFIHNIMDEVKYNDRGNKLEMVKRKI